MLVLGALLLVGCGASGPPFDSDGDGLPDDWERHGVDVDGDGVIDLDLAALGADPLHKDVFVEVDWMEVTGPGGHSDAWLPGALERVQQAFLAAPVENPDGKTGIVLHIDAGPDSLLDPRTLERWGDRSGANALEDEADLTMDRETEIRATQMTAARHGVFRYAIAGHSLAPIPNPLCADENMTLNGLAAGGELIVTQAAQTAFASLSGFRPYDEFQEAGLFMHELGHTLGLLHGGGDNVNRKPNYLSVMNYSFSYRGLRIDGAYGHLDYSRSASAPLDETALDEARGLSGLVKDGSVIGTIFFCPGATTLCEADVAEQATHLVEVDDISKPIDWNCSGSIDTAPVAANVNIETPGESLQGQDDWHALDYSAGGWVGSLPGTIP